MYSPEEGLLTQVLQVRPESVSVKQPNTSSYYETRDWKSGAGLRPHPAAVPQCNPAAFIFVLAFGFLPLTVENSEKVKIDFYWESMREAGSANPESENVSGAMPGGLPGRGVGERG